MMKTCARAPIVEIGPVSSRYFRMALHAPEMAGAAQPGQFVHVRIGEGDDPLLRRPLSFHDADPQTGRITLLVERLGRGTELLSRKKVGEELDLLGPLGRPFHLEPGAQTVALVGGGVGIPPLHFFARRSASGSPPLPHPPRLLAVIGARTREQVLCAEEFAALGAEVWVATDDGSEGFHGTAVDLLGEILRVEPVDQILTCGPWPMMHGAATLARERDIPCQASLEARMACGLGACLSCVVSIRPAGTGGSEYQRVCTEGPVFDARSVVWDG